MCGARCVSPNCRVRAPRVTSPPIPTQCRRSPQTKGGDLRTDSAGGVRPVARLACIAVVLVGPLLLLASPGRATARGAAHHRPPAPVTDARVVHAEALQPVAHTWAGQLVVPADLRMPTTTTTSTTLPPPKPVARVVVTTTTTTVPRTTTTTVPRTTTTTAGHSVTGQASWYTASTGICASPNLASGTVVTVTNEANGASTTCTIEDRNDPSTGRVLDMSEGSFSQIADPSQGVIEVRLTW